MKAWRVHELGHYKDVLRWEDCDPPEPPAAGVVIDVKSAALNFPDLLSIAGKYQLRAPLPFVPGLEAVGTISAVGADSQHAVGDRVILNAPWGAFAERMAAPDAFVFSAPTEMPDDHAAAFHTSYQTSYFGLVHRAHTQPGETVLVHGGGGGVGTSAIQIAKALGATVIATAGSAEKLEICTKGGADHVINHREQDFVSVVKKLTGGRGADVIYDPVGGDVFDKSTKCINFSGRLLVIGFASGRIPEIKANRILLKNIAIVGLHWGNYHLLDPKLVHDTHDKLIEMYLAGTIPPVIGNRYPIEQLPAALEAIESRTSHGKLVVDVAS